MTRSRTRPRRRQASASAAQEASFSTKTGRPMRSVSSWRNGRSASGMLTLVADATGGELHDAGTPMPTARVRRPRPPRSPPRAGRAVPARTRARRAEVVRADGRLPLSDAQDAWQARAALRRGQWQTVREAIDGLSRGGARAIRPGPTGTAARWPRQGDDTGCARLLPAHRRPPRTSTACWPTRSSATSPALPEDGSTCHRAGSRKPPASQSGPEARAQADPPRPAQRGRGRVDHSIRYFDDHQLLAASQFALSESIYDRAIHTADRTTRSHNYALRYPVPFQDTFREHAKTQGAGRGLGVRPGAPGEPLHHRGALLGRRGRPDAGDAAHRPLRRREDRHARLQAEERGRSEDQHRDGHRLHEDRAATSSATRCSPRRPTTPARTAHAAGATRARWKAPSTPRPSPTPRRAST